MVHERCRLQCESWMVPNQAIETDAKKTARLIAIAFGGQRPRRMEFILEQRETVMLKGSPTPFALFKVAVAG